MIVYNEKLKMYEIPDICSAFTHEEEGSIRFHGNIAPATDDENNITDIDSYIYIAEREKTYINKLCIALNWLKKNFTDIKVNADFYPVEQEYNVYIDINTTQFRKYCKNNNLPSPIN